MPRPQVSWNLQRLNAVWLFAASAGLACETATGQNDDPAADNPRIVKHVANDAGLVWVEPKTEWKIPYNYYSAPPPAGIDSDWKFGYKDSPVGASFQAFTATALMQTPTGKTVVRWIDPVSLAHAWMNTSSGAAYGVAPGEVAIHPGQGGRYATVRWMPKQSIRASIKVRFGKGDGGAMAYRVLQNKASGVSTTLWYSAPANITAEYIGMATMEVGDSVDFIVGEGYAWGSTPIDIEIYQVLQTEYSATDVFSNSSNGAGQFTYGWRQTPASSFVRYTTSSQNPYGWTTGNINGPKAWRPLTDENPMLPSKAIALFPGNGSEYSSMLFAVPNNATVWLDLTIYRGDGDWCPVEYIVRQNNVQIVRSTVPDGSVTKAYSGYLTLHMGDTIEVLIGNSVPGTGRSAGAAGVEFHLRYL